ncbi:hypothetical protein SAMN00790413_06355 [Deinococcus hopiensis KR-140]|uniref:Uncharacterized protein n=1 Tax=Deinococcus hopiensis KR-140 TaxID=695939 RepID=A0A1W1VUR0_9DEIO|nr:hypothetical protein SAMN00790413_06355 [Deinococcus hopiensis KR-140]
MIRLWALPGTPGKLTVSASTTRDVNLDAERVTHPPANHTADVAALPDGTFMLAGGGRGARAYLASDLRAAGTRILPTAKPRPTVKSYTVSGQAVTSPGLRLGDPTPLCHRFSCSLRSVESVIWWLIQRNPYWGFKELP